MALVDAAAIRLLLSGRAPYAIVTGTTNGTANTSSTFTHNLVDDKGRALTPALVIPFNNTGANTCYNGAVPTSAVIDVRSTSTSVSFTAIVFAALA